MHDISALTYIPAGMLIRFIPTDCAAGYNSPELDKKLSLRSSNEEPDVVAIFSDQVDQPGAGGNRDGVSKLLLTTLSNTSSTISWSMTTAEEPRVSGASALLKRIIDPDPTGDDRTLNPTLSAGDLGRPGPDHDACYAMVNMVQAAKIKDCACFDETDAHFDLNCKQPTVTPGNGRGGNIPILHLLLKDIAPMEYQEESPLLQLGLNAPIYAVNL